MLTELRTKLSICVISRNIRCFL